MPRRIKKTQVATAEATAEKVEIAAEADDKITVEKASGLDDTSTNAKKSTKRSVPKKKDAPTTINAKSVCMAKFREWWTTDELSAIISQVNPDIIMMFASDNKEVFNPDRLSEILYDTVGTRFLRNIDNDTTKRRLFLDLVLVTVTAKGLIAESVIVAAAKDAVRVSRKDSINGISDIIPIEMTNNLAVALAHILGLPPSVAEKEHVEVLPDTEVIIPHVTLNPLYDYQFTTGIMLRQMLEGTFIEHGKEVKRRMVSIPTGAGKTRMLVETIIEWLNDGKPSKNDQQRDSRFVLWIAQSSELCEQAFSTFKSVFEDRGRRGTTLHIHRFWGAGGALPSLGMDDLLDEKGIIVATIQSLYKILEQSGQLQALGRMTSCIIIDEAHHAVASSYSSVLREMGFNWDNRKSEISEWGIILLGLTATPFRGKGTGLDTERLKRRMGGTYFPTIPYSEKLRRYTPHAVVDCQTMAYSKDPIKILGEGSYDRDGHIELEEFKWTIKRIATLGEEDEETKANVTEKDGVLVHDDNVVETKKEKEKKVDDDDEEEEEEDDNDGTDTAASGQTIPTWTYNGQKNIIHSFKKPGIYEVALSVRDNDRNESTTSSQIRVEARPQEAKMTPEERQKDLYHRLIMRNILCDVYHKILASGSYELSIQDMKYMATFGEFRRETLKELGRDRSRNAMIVREIKRLNELGKRKILFFGCGVGHSRQIAMLLKVIYHMKVQYVDSKMDMDSRVNAIEQFRSGDLEVLCNYDVLTTGFDAPNIDCVFVGRPVKSTLLYTQMIGRGMRGTKNGGTESMLLVDIDDNFQLKDTFRSESVDLGWKVFRNYWKRWVDPYEGNDDSNAGEEEDDNDAMLAVKRPSVRGGKIEDDSVWDDDDDNDNDNDEDGDSDLTLTCTGCGIEVKGVSEIQKIFGIEGEPKLLIQCLQSVDHSMLPSECTKCRNK